MTGPRPTTAALLRALADLAPTGRDARADVLDVSSGSRPFVWFATDVHLPSLFGGAVAPGATTTFGPASWGIVPGGAPAVPSLVERYPHAHLPRPPSGGFGPGQRALGAQREALRGLPRLVRLDALHREERLLRAGWVFVTGTRHVGGKAVRILHPLVTVPVQLHRETLHRAGDLELSPLVPPEHQARLERADAFPDLDGWELTERSLARFPAFVGWVREVAAAAGFADLTLVPTVDPRVHRDDESLKAVVGVGLFQARDVDAGDLPTTLRNWAAYAAMPDTAFTHLLAPGTTPGPSPTPIAPSFDPPLVLTRTQRDAVARSHADPITVVSGPPGSGKSHAVAAIALDALAAGRRVLVATQADHASEVLARMFEALPGPDPLVFGSASWRGRLAATLADGLDDGVGPEALAEAERSAREAERERAWLEEQVVALLSAEQVTARTRSASWQARLPLWRATAPGAFAGDLSDDDLDELADLVRRAASEATGWWRRRRRRRADRRLRTRLGAGADAPVAALADAVRAAGDLRRASRLLTEGGTRVGPLVDALADAEVRRRDALGALLEARVRSGAARDVPARRAAQALATALRAGRATRRRTLAEVDPDALLAALPLWVGTLRDVDDLLPPRAGMFDLVILDEASQIDLPRATVALLRARRAVIAGDPRQLRHVSFVADADVQQVLADHGLAHALDRLDVRRLSAFDVAAGVAAPVWLDEHFRSVPHLIEFSARRFYDGVVHVATRHPSNEVVDAIDTVAVAGRRDDAGVNAAEVDAVEATLRRLVEEGERSIGVVSPFRAQADALEAMLLDRFTLDEIEALDLRVGTVHAFQGAERDVVVLSLALAPGDPAGSRRFAEDPHLFNVMVTRARRRTVVVHSLGADGEGAGDGLLADYLRHADQPPGPPATVEPTDPWVRALATELGRAGVPSRHDYPVGRWTLDLCIGDGEDAVAVACRVHPQGPKAHLERHLQLRRSGWRILEGWPSRFDDDPVRAALALCDELRHPEGATGPTSPLNRR